MPHPLVVQLRFTRSEFKRALKGLTDRDGCRRFLPMNSISWNVGHLSWQEQKYFLFYGQGQLLRRDIHKGYAFGAAASTPALGEMLAAWQAITEAADPWLDTLTSTKLQEPVIKRGKPSAYIFGSLLQRVIYHYWYHIGEDMAIRQQLGHTNLPYFVGDIDGQAPYRSR